MTINIIIKLRNSYVCFRTFFKIWFKLKLIYIWIHVWIYGNNIKL